MLVTDGLCSYAEKTPNKIAIQIEQQKITYLELHQRINQTAHALLYLIEEKTDVEHQPKVALLLDNSIDFLQLFLAVAKIGWIAVPLDTKWNDYEIGAILQKTCPNILVTQKKYIRKLPVDTHNTRLLMIGQYKREVPFHFCESFDHYVEQCDKCEPLVNQVSQHHCFYMGFTSGTTGLPKVFTRSHQSWVESFHGSNIEFNLNGNDHILIPGPFVHSLFLYAAIQSLSIGATVHLLKKFSANNSIEEMGNQLISVVYVVPTMFEAIVHAIYNDQEYRYFKQLRALISSGAKLNPISKEKIVKLLPKLNLYEFYGASELSFVTILDPRGNKEKPDSVGRAFHNVTISLRDSDGNEVKGGDIGLLFVKSKMVFSEYYQNEADTKKVLHQDGWATVGDLARQDEEGYFYIVGRENNMIIYGGLNVYPEEVEKVLLQIPEINEVAVIGVHDDYWGEKIVAFIKITDGKQLNDRAIRRFCRRQLAHYKCPRHIIFVKAFSYTTSGKISRKHLKQLFENGKKEHHE